MKHSLLTKLSVEFSPEMSLQFRTRPEIAQLVAVRAQRWNTEPEAWDAMLAYRALVQAGKWDGLNVAGPNGDECRAALTTYLADVQESLETGRLVGQCLLMDRTFPGTRPLSGILPAPRRAVNDPSMSEHPGGNHR